MKNELGEKIKELIIRDIRHTVISHMMAMLTRKQRVLTSVSSNKSLIAGLHEKYGK